MDNLFEKDWDDIVVGGGPAGYFAAIQCAEQARANGKPRRVLVIERARRSLGKVLISGGGRCNVTHACFEPAKLVTYYPRGGSALRGAFSRFQPRDLVQWFEQRGVTLKTEQDGRMFPITDSSRTIADCLETTAAKAGVVVWNQVALMSVVIQTGQRFEVRVHLAENDQDLKLNSATLLFATGSESYCHSLIATLGHKIEPPVPSLFTFKVTDPRIVDLAGISVQQVGVRLDDGSKNAKALPAAQAGPLLITHWGMSGPAVLRSSAWGARWLAERQYRASLFVNWLYPLSTDAVYDELSRQRMLPDNARKKPASQPFFPQISIRLWKRFCDAAGIIDGQNWADLSKPVLRRLAEELTVGQYKIEGRGVFKDEFVTCGGVTLDEVDFKTMQSRLIPGLFFAGEVLDIDGLTGGFNLQSAWTTGWLAGRAMAEK